MKITKLEQSWSMFTFAVTVIMLATMLASCKQPDEKVQAAKENVSEAKQELTQAQRDAWNERSKEWEPFKTESEAKLRINTKTLDDFKVRMSKSSTTFKERYEKRVDELEDRNNDLKDKIADYKDEGDATWKEFQQQISQDMDGLNIAIKDLPTSSK